MKYMIETDEMQLNTTKLKNITENIIVTGEIVVKMWNCNKTDIEHVAYLNKAFE